jgi:predicted SAM-dependent methyltransferase
VEARIPYESCPLCDGGEMEEARRADCTGHPLYKPGLPPVQRWVRCRACGHVFVDGYFTDEALAILFAESHPSQTPGYEVESSRYVWAKVVEDVGSLTAEDRGRWLDVGFGSGSLLTTAAEFGWDVVGLDLREANVRAMREHGFEAHAIELTRYWPAQPFDVISMADVLEHMPFPRAALDRAWELLAEGGVLFLSMPNADCFLWTTLDKVGQNPYWAELEHLHNFGRRRLYRLLEERGFAPRRYGVSVRYRACMEVIAQKVPRAAARVLVPAPRALGPGGGHPRALGPGGGHPRAPGPVRLNLGCGRSPLPGWVNVDCVDLPGVDLVVDLEKTSLPYADDSVTEIEANHVLERVRNALGFMQELHRVARPDAVATFRVPYGSSDDADEDPTHVRRYFWESWSYFSQPYYWRADYGYRGDWEVEEIVLTVDAELTGLSWEAAFHVVQRQRNVVKEMLVRLRAVKPSRAPSRDLQKQKLVRFVVG